MKILLLDNYDSFTYNLKHLVEDIIKTPIDIVKNDQIDTKSIVQYDKIILSPGPGIPEEAGLLKQVIADYSTTIPMLGVCLGHQAIGEVFGGMLTNLTQVYHGFATQIRIVKKDPLFTGLGEVFDAGRYHSWVVNNQNFPSCLDILAQDDEGMIMALKHKQYCVYGVQFHPESILTPCGTTLMKNFLYETK